MRLRTKAAIALAVFAALVAGACGLRAYIDVQAEEQARAEAEAAAAIEAPGADFSVGAVDDEVVAMLGGEAAATELAQKVATWCAENVEGATSAEWDQKASRDYKAGTVALGYVLDDDARTRVEVRVWPATGQYSVSKAVI